MALKINIWRKARVTWPEYKKYMHSRIAAIWGKYTFIKFERQAQLICERLNLQLNLSFTSNSYSQKMAKIFYASNKEEEIMYDFNTGCLVFKIYRVKCAQTNQWLPWEKVWYITILAPVNTPSSISIKPNITSFMI